MLTRAGERRAVELRRRLAVGLPVGGRAWRVAVGGVPRHVFVPEFFVMLGGDGVTRWEPVTPSRSGEDAWLTLAYGDDSLVTQLDGHLWPHQVAGPVSGSPTSSATMPRLVVRMWEDLGVTGGERVLEVGTGTGYSTALGCARLGEELITSIEVDPDVASRASTALAAAGYHPELLVGDGLGGHGGAYDRIIATCAVRHVPRPWIEQTRPGGLVLATLSGWLHASALLRLTVTAPGRAEGGFLPGPVSFMMARPHAAPPLGTITDRMRTAGDTRSTPVGPDVLRLNTSRLIAQLAAPTAQHVRVAIADDPETDYLLDPATASTATLTHGPDGWLVRQDGPLRLWDQIEDAVLTWQRAGEPQPHELTVTVTPEAQTVRLNARSEITWTLPTEA